MPDYESAVRALKVLQETGRASFPCIRFKGPDGYLYGDLYPRNDRLDTWKVGDRQQ